MSSVLGVWDVVTLLVYFGGLAWVGIRTAKRQRKSHGGDAYFLADHDVSWWACAASLFASNIGAEHFVGLSGLSAYSGIAVSFYEFGACICLVVLGYLFLPIYFGSKVHSMPQWLEERYSEFCGTALVAISIALYVLTKVAATLYAGELILTELSTGSIPPWLSVLILIGCTTLYTVTGGLEAVIYTETLQTVILLVGGSILFGLSLSEVGGLETFFDETQRASSGSRPPHYYQIFRPASDPEFPWTGFLTGYYITSLWYWCNDQVIVQRAIASKTIQHGRAGCVSAAYLKLLPGFLMCIPGLIARQLMEEEGALTEESPRSEYDRAFLWLLLKLMPKNLRGLLIAAMMSALMSSLASVFNSCSTVFTLDVYKKYKTTPTTEREIVWVGRITVLVVACLSCAWLPLIPILGNQIFLWIQKPPSYFAPPLFSLFLWGCLLRGVNATGAVACLGFGVGFGALRFVLEILATVHGFGGLSFLVKLNFLHFSAVNFLLSTLVLIGVSYAYPSKEKKDVVIFSLDLYSKIRRDGIVSRGEGPGGEDEALEMVRLRPVDAKDSSAGGEMNEDEDKAALDQVALDEAAEPSGTPSRALKSSDRWSFVIHGATVAVILLFCAILVYFE